MKKESNLELHIINLAKCNVYPITYRPGIVFAMAKTYCYERVDVQTYFKQEYPTKW